LIIGSLIYLKWKEGRVTLFGRGSKAYKDRLARQREGSTIGSHEMSDVTPGVEKKVFVGEGEEGGRTLPTLNID